MKNALLIPSVCLVIILFSSFLFLTPNPYFWSGKTPVYEVLQTLGAEPTLHEMELDPSLVAKGEELVKIGKTIGPDGKRTRYISKYYTCTSCHNLEREDPILNISDPETRLPYVKEHNLPFLQGTTFRGIVNRESWYNDDYVKKYGDEKIIIANKNLREAIQLCAIECSQGRYMEDWELDAVLAYYWTLQWRLEDLPLTDQDYEWLNDFPLDKVEKEARIHWLKSLYLKKSPAHFFDAPPNKREGYEGLIGDPEKGKDIYELSCLHCHKEGGVSHYILDSEPLSYEHLYKMIPKNSHFSLYQIIAYGTYAIPGHKPYMPHYPLERMSKQQVEDLRAFIETMCQ